MTVLGVFAHYFGRLNVACWLWTCSEGFDFTGMSLYGREVWHLSAKNQFVKLPPPYEMWLPLGYIPFANPLSFAFIWHAGSGQAFIAAKWSLR